MNFSIDAMRDALEKRLSGVLMGKDWTCLFQQGDADADTIRDDYIHANSKSSDILSLFAMNDATLRLYILNTYVPSEFHPSPPRVVRDEEGGEC